MNASSIVKELTRAKWLHETILQNDKDYLYEEWVNQAIKHAKTFGIRGWEMFSQYQLLNASKFNDLLWILNRYNIEEKKPENLQNNNNE